MKHCHANQASDWATPIPFALVGAKASASEIKRLVRQTYTKWRSSSISLIGLSGTSQ